MSARIAPATGVVAVLILLMAAACDNNGTQPAPTATIHQPVSLATTTPTATAAPEVIDGVEVLPLQLGEEAELPSDVALIVERNFQGWTGGLYRVYRNASGEIKTDTLAPSSEEGGVHSWAMNGDASEIVIDFCTGGCVSIGDATPDAQQTLYRSTDGGITWQRLGALDGSYYVVALRAEGILLFSPPGAHVQREARYDLFPNGEPLEPPPGASRHSLILSGDEVVWATEDGRLLRSDGSEYLAIGEGNFAPSFASSWKIDLDPEGTRIALTYWLEQQHHLGLFSVDRRSRTAFSTPTQLSVGGWLDSNLLIGSASIPAEYLSTPVSENYSEFHNGTLPVLIDLEARLIHPIPHPFLDLSSTGRRQLVQVVLHGPFARVVNTGGCLDVRQEPAPAAAVLACAADGVLLRDTGETQEADGAAWRRVVTPAGVEGWASSQFLER